MLLEAHFSSFFFAPRFEFFSKIKMLPVDMPFLWSREIATKTNTYIEYSLQV